MQNIALDWLVLTEEISFKQRVFVKKAIAGYKGVFMLVFKENKCFSASYNGMNGENRLSQYTDYEYIFVCKFDI